MALRGKRSGVCSPQLPLPHLIPHHLLLGLGTCASVQPFPLGVRNSGPSRSSFLLAWSTRENPALWPSQTPL